MKKGEKAARKRIFRMASVRLKLGLSAHFPYLRSLQLLVRHELRCHHFSIAQTLNQTPRWVFSWGGGNPYRLKLPVNLFPFFFYRSLSYGQTSPVS